MKTGTFNITKIACIYWGKDLFCLAQVLRYECANGDRIAVPLLHRKDALGNDRVLGFLTDFASKPWLAQFLVGDRCDEGVPAYCLHDWLYCAQRVTRYIDGQWRTVRINQDYADNVLLEACVTLGMDADKAHKIYLGVCVGGASHFNNPLHPLKVGTITPENPTEDFAVLPGTWEPSMYIEGES